MNNNLNIGTATPVPKDQSAFEKVIELWAPILGKCDAIEIHESLWFGISRFINFRQENFQTGKLDPKYNWHADLNEAILYHGEMIVWARKFMSQQTRREGHWIKTSELLAKVTYDIEIAGIKMAFISHGAVAIGGLGLIAQNDDKGYLFYAATTAIMFSAIGILMLAIGAIIVSGIASKMNKRVQEKLQESLALRDISAIHRYARRFFGKREKVSDFFIYGSVIWFVFYVFVFVIVLFHR